MTTWMLWLTIAIVLFIVEIITPGFVIACFGVGALGAALAAFLNLGVFYQTSFFVITTVLSFIIIRPFYFRYLVKNTPGTRTNIEALIGRKAIVLEPIDPLKSQGRVKIDGEDWKATSVNEEQIQQGTPVVIRGVDGVKLIVEPISGEESP